MPSKLSNSNSHNSPARRSEGGGRLSGRLTALTKRGRQTHMLFLHCPQESELTASFDIIFREQRQNGRRSSNNGHLMDCCVLLTGNG